MQVMNRAFAGRKFQMIAVSVDEDWNAVTAFYKRHGLSIPSYSDPGGQGFGVNGIPQTYILDSDGALLKRYTGRQPWASPEMLAMVESLIGDR